MLETSVRARSAAHPWERHRLNRPEHPPTSGPATGRYGIRVWLTFALPSLLGLLLFLAPMPDGDSVSIPIAILAKRIQQLTGDHLRGAITIIITASALASLLVAAYSPRWLRHRPLLNALFTIPPFWLAVRILGAVFAVMCFAQFGPDAIIAGNTGGLVLYELLPILMSVFILAGLLLPLLLEFGLLELIGTLMTPLMRPVFGLPGRAAIDCAASWLGDGSVGIMLTSKQYEAGFYTQREAAVIGTNFSAVSITFCLVVISQVRLEHLFWEFYLTICAAGLAAALIVPRLPPLSRKPDQLVDHTAPGGQGEAIPEGYGPLSWGLDRALHKAAGIGSLTRVAAGGLRNAVDMLLGLLPVVMAIGTTALVVAEHTPLFEYLGRPFLPLLEWLRIPDAEAASHTVLVGFADMFIPSIMAASLQDEMTRFVIATLSVTQLIYLSEVGALLLGSSIPLRFRDLIAVFLLRTLVTLPVIAAMGHWLVP